MLRKHDRVNSRLIFDATQTASLLKINPSQQKPRSEVSSFLSAKLSAFSDTGRTRPAYTPGTKSKSSPAHIFNPDPKSARYRPKGTASPAREVDGAKAFRKQGQASSVAEPSRNRARFSTWVKGTTAGRDNRNQWLHFAEFARCWSTGENSRRER
ncbi:hypothetical protein KM043_018660 [Ampulex compressa]|nr:hypothetical protein KM043_018660 [Ampulex compressa]